MYKKYINNTYKMLFKNIINFIKKFNNKNIIFKIFVLFILLILVCFASNKKEGFAQHKKYTVKNNDEIFSDYYANMYDNILLDKTKYNTEIDEISKIVDYNEFNSILDVGCGTGEIVNILNDQPLGNKTPNILGLDKSQEMINVAKRKYPNNQYVVGDINDNNLFQNNFFTHILCLNQTIYYIKDKEQFFNNCYNLLLPNGYLIIHLVDRNNFNSISTATNLNPLVNPDNYSIKNINNSIINYNDVTYTTKFSIFPNDFKSNANAVFKETIEEKISGNILENVHNLYMPTQQETLELAKKSNFKFIDVINLSKNNYKYEYIYVLQK